MGKTVIAYEDEPTLRTQLENVFYSLRDEFSLLETFPNPKNVAQHLSEYHPDIVIMDIQMDGEDDGLYALCQIKNKDPKMKVMMLTTFDIDDKIFNAICLGADGYMLKTDFTSHMPQEAMRKSLRTIFEGGAYLTPSVAKRILSLFADVSMTGRIQSIRDRFQAMFTVGEKNKEDKSGLTRMQLTVLKKIVEGKSTSEIAKELFLSENTINSHIKAVYATMEVHSRSMAIRKALEEKWV